MGSGKQPGRRSGVKPSRQVAIIGLLAATLTGGHASAEECAEPMASSEAAWAVGFATVTHHFCPDWEPDFTIPEMQQVLPSPKPGCFDRDWGDDSRVRIGFKAGGLAAQAAFETTPAFCADPRAPAPATDLVRRLLLPRRAGE